MAMNLCSSVWIHHHAGLFAKTFIFFAFFTLFVLLNQIHHFCKLISFFPSAHRDIESFPFNKVILLIIPTLIRNDLLNHKIIFFVPLKVRVVDFLLNFVLNFHSFFPDYSSSFGRCLLYDIINWIAHINRQKINKIISSVQSSPALSS